MISERGLIQKPPPEGGGPIAHSCHGRRVEGVWLFKSLNVVAVNGLKRTAAFGLVAVGGEGVTFWTSQKWTGWRLEVVRSTAAA